MAAKEIVDWDADKSDWGKERLILKICDATKKVECIERVATNYLSMVRENRGLPGHFGKMNGLSDLPGYENFESTFSKYPKGAVFGGAHAWFFCSVFDILQLRLEFTEDNFERFKSFTIEQLMKQLPARIVFAIETNWVSFPDTSVHLHSNFLDPTQHYADWKNSQVIDQKQMYLSKVAAWKWSEVIGSRAGYHKLPKTQRDCANQLASLMRSQFLLKEAKKMPFDRVVFLGAAGCHKEENVITDLDRIPENKKRFSVWFVDTSDPMLRMSNETILALDDQLQDRLKSVLYIRSKFESLPRHPAWFRRFPANRTIYMILGGTFGNNDEKDFLSAMKSIMLPDDLLIINADTFTKENEDRFKAEKVEEYRTNPSIGVLVATPLLEELVPPKDADSDILNRCDVRTVSYGEQGSDCGIPGSFSVQYVWKSGARGDSLHIRLSTSKKYLESKLLEFLDTQGFKLKVERDAEGHGRLPFVCALKKEDRPDDQ